jgi:hypothetical protein
MLDTFQYALRIANHQHMNIVVVVNQDRPRWQVVSTALQQAAVKQNCAAPERVVVINPKLRNIPGNSEDDWFEPYDSAAAGNGIADFEYNQDRPLLMAFLLAAAGNSMQHPMQIVRRDEFCRRGCGDEG